MTSNSDRLQQRREAFSIEQIERMVNQFYGRVRDDEFIGPVFEQRVSDWPYHLDRMVLFWRAVLRSEPTFVMSERGGPPTLHRAIEELQMAHFVRWLELFSTVVEDIFAPEEAAEIELAATRIGHALSRHLPA